MNRALVTTSFVCMCLVGCTDPGEMTGMGAAAGGVMGAGLGAIVGSQTGDAGTGLVIGAAAGAATGAAVGNVLQAQDETIRSQDEAIERQQHIMAANQRELTELKRSHDDGYRPSDPIRSRTEIAPRASLRSPYSSKSTQRTYSYSNKQAERTKSHTTTSAIRERDLGTRQAARVVKAAPPPQPVKPEIVSSGIIERELPGVNTESRDDSVASIPEPKVESQVVTTASDDCKKAGGEIEKASASKEIADRLFHYRRALRLCPDSARYHNLLGETYVSLNRTVDAEFEFREALKLDPTLQVARNNLDSLR